MQTSAPGGHSFIIRPSTSPVPSFSGDLHNVRKVAQSRLLHNAASTAGSTRLRPLPGRNSLMPPTGASALDAMRISGKQTGEEKVFTAVERREPVAATKASCNESAASNSANGSSSAANSATTQIIKKLEADLRKAREQLKQRTTEKETLKDKLSHQDSVIDGCNKRILDLQQQVQGGTLALADEKQASQGMIRDLQQQLASAEACTKAREEEMKKLEAQYQQQLHEAEALHKSVVDARERAHEQLRDEFSRHKSSSDTADRRNEDLRRELQSVKDAHAKELQLAGGREAKLSAELREARALALERETRLEGWKSQIADCNSYIVKICQPQFSVVKDESLAPVPSDDPDAGGFVLVPLHLMLEGYQLLPAEMKKRIADEYERSRKNPLTQSSGAAPAPTRPGNSVTSFSSVSSASTPAAAANSTLSRSASIGHSSGCEPAPHRPTTSPTPNAFSMRGRK